jgi:DNA-binding transcriptional ArsR family regulator
VCEPGGEADTKREPEYPPLRSLRYLLWWLIGGSKGGHTRGRIILALREEPGNPNQIAERLKIDYKTARYHLEILQRNGLAAHAGEGYAATYFISPSLEERYTIFEEIWRKVGEKKKAV